MSHYHCLAAFLAGVAVGMALLAWILHRADALLAASHKEPRT